MIALHDQAYYVPGSPKYLRTIYPQVIHTSELYKCYFIAHLHDDHYSYAELNLKEDKPCWKKAKPVGNIYINYDPNNNLPNHEDILLNHR